MSVLARCLVSVISALLFGTPATAQMMTPTALIAVRVQGCWGGPNHAHYLFRANAGASCGKAADQLRSLAELRTGAPGLLVAPDFSSRAYQADLNPFVEGGLGGQCTAYVYGRALEVTGRPMDFTGYPKDWISKTHYSTGMEPRAGAIAVWAGMSPDSGGHVAFVESVTNGKVTITEANVMSFNGSRYGGGYDGAPRTFSFNQMRDRSSPDTGQVGKLVGYVYLK